MERSEENKTYKDKEEERFKEKIVYKIIPVPYYYPVPVDPDWYNKNYERQFRPNEFTSFPFVDTTVEHFVPPPPPGFPFPRFRHPHHHFIYEPSTNNKRVVSSPPLQTTNHSQQSTSPPKKQVENGRDEETPHVVKSNQNGISIESIVPVCTSTADKCDIAAELDRHKDTNNISCDEIIIKTEIDDDSETVIVNGAENNPNKVIHHEENEIEAIRDRKRYLMTFPYDQKKKIKVNGHAEGHETVKAIVCEQDDEAKSGKPECNEKETVRSEAHETHYAAFPPNHAIRYPAVPSNHQTVMPQAVPYVMVPVQSPAFLHPKIVHQPHFATEHRRPSFEEGKHATEVHDLKLDFEDRSKEQKAESPGEVKYHPNGRRARTVFTRQQLLTLNNVFEKHHFVSGERMSELSDQLGLDRKIVKIWFQNKRQYSRKKGSLLEREEDYFEYQDSFSSGTAPPTMTMVNHTRTMDDMNYKISDDNLNYKLNDDYMNEKSSSDENNMNYKLNDEKVSYEVNEPV